MTNELVSKKIKYYLYIYNDIDKKVKQLESDIIDSSSITVNTWLRGKHCFTNTIENQAIVLASCKQLKELKQWKENLSRILKYIKQYYPEYYKYIELKYFKKIKSNQIKSLLNMEINVQSKIDKKVISLINKANFFYKNNK